jgi:hypothetical protein
MTGQGDFAAHRRDGDYVIKVLDVQHPAGTRFAAVAARAGRTGMDTYLSTLRAAGVTLPPDLALVSAEPLTIRHRWVTGPVLADCAGVDRLRFAGAVAEVARWVDALAATDARLRLVVVPHLTDTSEPARLRYLPEAQARQVIAENCFTPRDEFWIRPWLIPRQQPDDLLRRQANAAVGYITATVPCVEVSFGVRSPVAGLVRVLERVIGGVR